jgi:uncharacterized protein YkwD
MRRPVTVLVCAVLALHVGVGSTTSAQAMAPAARGWKARLQAEVNSVRLAVGLPFVRLCPALSRAARAQAADLASGVPIGHVGRDGSEPGERVSAQGYRWRVVAENVAAGQQPVEEAMAAWMESPGHQANLLHPEVRHAGFARVVDPYSPYGTYWVQVFARGGPC